MEFWSGFWGAVIGSGLAAAVVLTTHFLVAAREGKKARELALERLLAAADGLVAIALTPDRPPGVSAAEAREFFRVLDLVHALRRTALHRSEGVSEFARVRLIILYTYDNLGAISAARSSLGSGLSMWVATPLRTSRWLKLHAPLQVKGTTKGSVDLRGWGHDVQ